MAISSVDQVPDLEDAAEDASSRRCGRCQGVFDSADDVISIPDWWVCDACRAKLIPGSVR